MITLKTSKGDIKIKLFEKEAPITVKNFLDYIDAGFYKGTIFHRVIPGFMVQGGGFTADFVQKPTSDPIKNEADNQLSNKRGTLAMARTSVVDSATASSSSIWSITISSTSRPPRRSTSATACSARSSKGWMSSTRSRRSRPVRTRCTATCRPRTS